MTDLETRFLDLIQRHAGLLCKVCRIYARTEADREDLHQEILAQLWRALPAFRGAAKETTWMYRVALNTAIAFYRKQRTHRRLVPEAAPTPETWRAACPDPAVEAATRDRLDRLYAAIARLSDAEKAVVLLYLDDVPYRDIAATLGISESNVGVRLHRLKKKLSKTLAEVTI